MLDLSLKLMNFSSGGLGGMGVFGILYFSQTCCAVETLAKISTFKHKSGPTK